jgi:type VI protein secretion system component Hcp
LGEGAAVALYKCDGILKLVKNGQTLRGESRDALYKNCIEIQSFVFGSSDGFDDEEAYESAADANLRGSMTASGGAPAPRLDFASDRMDSGDVDPATVDACQFKITKQLDWASPDLFRAYCSAHDLRTREEFESATVVLRKAGGKGTVPYLVFHFSEVVVFGYQLEINESGTEKETVNLGFAKCRMEYSQQGNDGRFGVKVQSGWSFTDKGAW